MDLSALERGEPYPGEYERDLAAVQKRLAEAQLALVVQRRRAMIVLEGWDAAGKGGIIRRLAASWDPRHVSVYPVLAPSTEERGRHFLWRFWSKLPGPGEIAVFDRSWYGRVLGERVDRLLGAPQLRRAFDEINEFEAEQQVDGVVVIKLFPHVSGAEQERRLRARLGHPWTRSQVTADQIRRLASRDEYLAAMADMFTRTDTRWAPWFAFDAGDERAGRIAALTHVADRLEAVLDAAAPPLDPEVQRLARAAFGDLHPA